MNKHIIRIRRGLQFSVQGQQLQRSGRIQTACARRRQLNTRTAASRGLTIVAESAPVMTADSVLRCNWRMLLACVTMIAPSRGVDGCKCAPLFHTVSASTHLLGRTHGMSARPSAHCMPDT